MEQSPRVETRRGKGKAVRSGSDRKVQQKQELTLSSDPCKCFKSLSHRTKSAVSSTRAKGGGVEKRFLLSIQIHKVPSALSLAARNLLCWPGRIPPTSSKVVLGLRCLKDRGSCFWYCWIWPWQSVEMESSAGLDATRREQPSELNESRRGCKVVVCRWCIWCSGNEGARLAEMAPLHVDDDRI